MSERGRAIGDEYAEAEAQTEATNRALADQRVRITVDVTVTDPTKLRAYADKRARAAWGEPFHMFNAGIQGAVYEALIGSSEGPEPSVFGVSIDMSDAVLIDEHGEPLV